jgi:ATP-dependent DNA helicase RecQ
LNEWKKVYYKLFILEIDLLLQQNNSNVKISDVKIVDPVKTEVSAHDYLEAAVKEFYRDPNASFKSSFQKHATDICFSRKTDLIVRMPTGDGKSLIYQLAAFAERSTELVTIVLTPLRSLIMDQIRNINEKWPRLASELTIDIINSSTSSPPLIYIHYNDYSKHMAFIMKLIKENRLARVVFDEAQTLVLWDRFTFFRQSLPLIRTDPFPLVFLSGSASPAVIDELVDIFNLPMPQVIFKEAARINLKYEVEKVKKLTTLPQITEDERMIIFVSKREDVNLMEVDVVNNGFYKEKILKYHGGMQLEEKNENQDKWMTTKGALMIATSAFALGIDYPKVRHVFIVGSAYGLDNLIQMWGRAGRDGLKSYCHYIFSTTQPFRNDQESIQLSKVENYQKCIR